MSDFSRFFRTSFDFHSDGFVPRDYEDSAMHSVLLLLVIHGWLDGYYTWNDNHPDPKLNFFDGVGTTAHRADQFALNIAAIEISRDPKPFGFHVVAGAGDTSSASRASTCSI